MRECVNAASNAATRSGDYLQIEGAFSLSTVAPIGGWWEKKRWMVCWTIIFSDEVRSDYYCGNTGLGFREATATQQSSRVMTRNTGTVSLWFVSDTR